jgi:hypothetical protein
MQNNMNELDLINWSNVSRLLTNDKSRTQIKSTYNGKRYAKKVAGLIRLIRFWVRWQNGL